MSTARAAEPHAAQRAPAPAWLPVTALFLISVVVYAVLALRSPLPVLFPDEFRYSHLARGMADGTGSDWRGTPIDQTAALYVYFIVPAWALFSSSVDAWHASKVMGTIALCAQVFPVWWLARDVLRDARLALIPAVLSVLGTWMLSSAETVTEVLAFPLVTAALCCAVMALRRPGSRLGWLALVLLGLATWVRLQNAILAPALLAAFLIDIARVTPYDRMARVRAYAPYLIISAAAFLFVALIALAAPDAFGDYDVVFSFRPGLGKVVDKSALQLAELAAVAGLLPVLLAAGAAVSRRAWRDDRSGPLLAVFWPSAIATVLLSGFFLAGYPPAPWAIGRYVTYAVPLALILMVVVLADRKLLTRASYVVAALGAVAFVVRPTVQMMGEERATWGLTYRLHQVFSVDVAAGLVVVSLMLVALTYALRRDGRNGVLIVTGVVGLLLVVQSQAAWWQMTTTGKSFRSVMADNLEWVDDHARGDVALLAVTQNAPQFDDIDFFNRKITQAYAPAAGILGRAIQGKVCSLRFDTSGLVVLGRGCGATPHWLLVNDPSARLTFKDELASWSEPTIGRLVEVDPSKPPRARSLVVLPCPRRTPGYSASTPDIVPADVPIQCAADLTAALWLDAPATLVVHYRGGPTAETVKANGKTYKIPARGSVDVRVAVSRGYTQSVVTQGWTSSANTPTIAGVDLVGSDGAISRLA
ncbi:hypothetical protein [Baekduia sp. Peel2402]|uniref:hypothetical protein n=1 Tax=Baekduia sp. Peel2402 TaxID=3458296 RepID=UPI00403E3B8F